MAFNKKTVFRRAYTIAAIPVILLIAVSLFLALRKSGNGFKEQAYYHSITGFEELEASSYADASEYDNVLVAENEKYGLYLHGPTLSISVKDLKSGAVMESSVEEDDGRNNPQWLGFMKSGLVLDVISGVNDTVQADFINNKNNVLIAKVKDGFRAKAKFPDFGISFEIRVVLDKDSVIVEIPDDKIVESMPQYHIGAISVLPFLGYSYLGEKEGYMLIPDGNGALIYLNDKERKLTGGFSQMIYGDDTGFKDSTTVSLFWDRYQTVNDAQNIIAPVFGMVHTGERMGYLGIVESGAQRASIEAYPNGVKVDYNRIYAKFLMRKVYTQPTSNSNVGTIKQIEQDRSHYDIRVRYCFVSGSDADYTGLAVRYRDYLLTEQGLRVKDEGYRTRVDFLGTEREEWLAFKKTVPMTTADNILDIYEELKEEGISDILTVYKGWQDGGIYALPIASFKADSAIGGTKKLIGLVKSAEESGIMLYLYQDGLRINPEENNTAFNVVKRIDKRLYEEITYKEVYDRFLYLTPKRSGYYLDKTSKEYLKKGIRNIALAGITNHLFSYSYSGSYYSRVGTMNAYESMVSILDAQMGLALEQPFSYLWKYTDAFLDMPVGSSNYTFADEEVPFLAISLKGVIPLYSEYMNFEANKKEFLLKLVEMGIFPSFYITYENSSDLIYTNSSDIYTSMYSTYKDEIIHYTDEMKELYGLVKGSFIIGHERNGSGLTTVNYDNGITIYINYGDKAVTVDGYVVEAMSYKVGDAG